jgi:hypothetical protein
MKLWSLVRDLPSKKETVGFCVRRCRKPGLQKGREMVWGDVGFRSREAFQQAGKLSSLLVPCSFTERVGWEVLVGLKRWDGMSWGAGSEVWRLGRLSIKGGNIILELEGREGRGQSMILEFEGDSCC